MTEDVEVKVNLPMDHRAREAKKNAFIGQLRQSGMIREACAAAGISRTQAYRWKDRDSLFADRWMEALEDAADILEAEAWRRALDHSDTLLIFLLKGLRPEKFNDKVRHDHFSKGPQEIVFKVVHEPTDELGDTERKNKRGEDLITDASYKTVQSE